MAQEGKPRNMHSNRRDFLKTAALGATPFLLAGCSIFESARSKSTARPPNIVFIMVDDMGPFDPGCYGPNAQGLETPNIDRIARNGIRFTQAYAGCSLCAPSRCSLMTGKHLGHCSVRGNTGGIPLDPSETTIAEVLKTAGYATGGFGKWGIADVQTEGVPEKNGFDVFFGYYHQIHAHSFWPEYLWRNSEKVEMTGEPGTAERYSHYRIVDEMKNFIRGNAERPFFCYGPWTPPHGNFQIPETDPAWREFKDRPWPRDARVYAAMIRMVDRHIGEILDLLEELEIAENTAIFFCSDNGGTPNWGDLFRSNGPFRGEKRTLYEGGLRVPFVAQWPGHIAPGSESDHLTYFPDVLPTLAEMAGVADRAPSNVDGLSLAPTLEGRSKEQQSQDYLYWENPVWDWGRSFYPEDKFQQALRQGRWKIVRHGASEPWELYDLDVDISEKNDLASRRPDMVENLASLVMEAHEDGPEQIEPEMPPGRKFR